MHLVEFLFPSLLTHDCFSQRTYCWVRWQLACSYWLLLLYGVGHIICVYIDIDQKGCNK